MKTATTSRKDKLGFLNLLILVLSVYVLLAYLASWFIGEHKKVILMNPVVNLLFYNGAVDPFDNSCIPFLEHTLKSVHLKVVDCP